MATPIAEAGALEVSGTGLSREPSRSATFYAAKLARRAGKPVYLDLDFRADQWRNPRAFGVMVRALLPLVTVISEASSRSSPARQTRASVGSPVADDAFGYCLSAREHPGHRPVG